MVLIEYIGHIDLRSLTDGHLGRHLEYFKTLNDARVASVGFINYNASTTRINKEKNFKIKFQVILVFYRTIVIRSICAYMYMTYTINLTFVIYSLLSFIEMVCTWFLSESSLHSMAYKYYFVGLQHLATPYTVC